MSPGEPRVLEALRLSELLRLVCVHAGMPVPPDAADERFIVRTGAEPPELFAAMLEEAFVEDEAEVVVLEGGEPPDGRALPPGHVAVCAGFEGHCPATVSLFQAACPTGGRALAFAIERRDLAGSLLGVTWAAIPEAEPAPKADFRAAVLRIDAPR